MACDAELQEKPLAELRKLGEMLRERCLAYMTPNENDDATAGADGKGKSNHLQRNHEFFFNKRQINILKNL